MYSNETTSYFNFFLNAGLYSISNSLMTYELITNNNHCLSKTCQVTYVQLLLYLTVWVKTTTFTLGKGCQVCVLVAY